VRGGGGWLQPDETKTATNATATETPKRVFMLSPLDMSRRPLRIPTPLRVEAGFRLSAAA